MKKTEPNSFADGWPFLEIKHIVHLFNIKDSSAI